MQTETLEYKLNFDKFGQPRKYKLNKKRRLKLTDFSTWLESDTKNQWYFKDYNCFYIVISMFNEGEYTVSCSGYTLDLKYNNLDEAKQAAFNFCNER